MAFSMSKPRQRPGGERPGFVAWWLQELAGLWPRPSRGLAKENFIVARFDGATLRFASRTRAGIEHLAVVDLDDPESVPERQLDILAAQIRRSRLPLVLRLAPELGLVAFDRLPQTAKKDLRPIIVNRLDGMTPWSAESAIFDLVRLERAADGMLEVELAVAPKRTIERAEQALAELDLEADFVDLAEEDGFAQPTHNLVHDRRPPRLPRAVTMTASLLAAAAIVAGVLAFFDLNAREAALAQRQRYASLLEERLADLPTLRARIETLEGEGRSVLERHGARPSALVTIEALSRILPDTVWLESLTLNDRQLTLSGYGAEAAQLPSILESHNAFDAARFAAPSERVLMPKGEGDEVVEVDRFSLQADVRPDATLVPR